MKHRLVRIFTLVMLLAAFSSAQAKQEPYVEDPTQEWGGIDSPFALPTGLFAYALFGQLNTYGDVDAFTQTYTAPASDVPLEVFIPMCGDHSAPVYPSVALVGAGLDMPEDGALPFALPEGMGAVVYAERERAEPRAAGIRYYESHSYQPSRFLLDIPEAGDYQVVIWEPDGHIGAYILSVMANEHSLDNDRTVREREAAFALINSGDWITQDCSAAAAAAECESSQSAVPMPMVSIQTTEMRGDRYEIIGNLHDSETCLPVANARVRYWLENETGDVSDAFQGMVVSNQQGNFRIMSALPEPLEPNTRIHLEVASQRYDVVLITYLLPESEA